MQVKEINTILMSPVRTVEDFSNSY